MPVDPIHASGPCRPPAIGSSTQSRNSARSMLPPQRMTPTRFPHPVALLQQRRQRRGARAFRQVVGVRPIGADRRRDLVIGHGDDARGARADDRQRRRRRACAPPCRRRGCRAVGRHRAAGGEGQRVGRRASVLCTPTISVRRPSASRAAMHAADAGAEPDRHIERVERRRGAEQLQRIGRDAAHQIAVEGRREFQPARPPARIACSRAASKSLAVLDQLARRTPAWRRSSRRCCRCGTTMVDGMPCARAGKGERLAVIAAASP